MKEGSRDRKQRSVGSQGNPEGMVKIFDLTDHEPDSNGEYTSATSEGLALPESFTICAAVMVEAWTTDFSSLYMFVLLDAEGSMWGYVQLGAAYVNTKYQVQLGPLFNIFAVEAKFFPEHSDTAHASAPGSSPRRAAAPSHRDHHQSNL